MVASIFAFVDRHILSLLVAPIRQDLQISDTQMSLLIGASFALFFGVLGLPLGRLGDRYSRRGLIAGGFAAWSICTASCGFVRNYGQMLLMRMGVGAGEAALNPNAFSIITDTFPEGQRSTALGTYQAGIYFGSGLSFLAGGALVGFAASGDTWLLPIVGAVEPWRMVLVVFGLAGLPFSLLIRTLEEPERLGRLPGAGSVPLAEVAGWVRRHRKTLFCHHLGFSLCTLASLSAIAWLPEMFRRTYGWSIPKFGFYFGIELAIFGSLGVVVGGRIADRWLQRGITDAHLRAGIAAALLGLGMTIPALLAPSAWLSLMWLAPGLALQAAPSSLSAAALQQILPAGIRSQVTALNLLIVNVVAAAIGPTLTALLAEHLFETDRSLPYALTLVHVAALLPAALLLWIGRTPYRQSYQELVTRAQQDSREPLRETSHAAPAGS
jgi:MFS family permease